MTTHDYADFVPDDDIEDCASELRVALETNGIRLPSFGVDLPSWQSPYAQPLVTLGNCNMATARKLAAALQKAAAA